MVRATTLRCWQMKLHVDKLPTRLAGSALGIGFVVIGVYAILGQPEGLDASVSDRAFWFGVTSVIGGVLALAMSWLAGRLDNIWCAPPRRGWWL